MFGGADAQLVQDALIIAALAAAGGFAFAIGFRKLHNRTADDMKPNSKGELEERVEVLERIATDRTIGLADEIEQLRTTKETA
ncbi:MAG: hypothetical protein HKO08_12110 [Erythrobacter sp.]|nr:hypothetical protein [Erythrobacter sp.]